MGDTVFLAVYYEWENSSGRQALTNRFLKPANDFIHRLTVQLIEKLGLFIRVERARGD